MIEQAEVDGGRGYFLSYSRHDELFALRLANDLRDGGVTLWVDQLDIRPSEHWDRAIERAVRNCRGILVVLSPQSVSSDNVADEISFAIDSGKSVLPVMIERCSLPLRITRMQVIDATRDYQEALRKCVDELRRQHGTAAPDSDRRPGQRGELHVDLLNAAKRELSHFLGPIARVLVDKAARSVRSKQDLYEILAPNIENDAERERFLKNANADPAAAQTGKMQLAQDLPALAAADIAAISKALTRYLGPIAAVVTKRESAVCHSADELKERLATLIPSEQERHQFLREAQCG